MKFFGLKDVLATSGGQTAKSTDGTDSRFQHKVLDGNRGSTAATHRFWAVAIWDRRTDGRMDRQQLRLMSRTLLEEGTKTPCS